MHETVAGLVVFGLYLSAIVGVGLVTRRAQRTAADLWVAGRRFRTGVMVVGLMASIMHGGSILSGVAFAGAFGGVAILPFMSFALGFLVIQLFFARRLRELGALTLSDYMADRFESVGLRAFTAGVIAAASIVYLVAQVRGMGLILEALLHVPFVPAMALGTTLFVFYVATGGILAVMWTNIAQFVFMWVGLLILLPGTMAAAGGWTEVLEQAEAIAPGWTSVRGTQWSWEYLLSWWLVWLVAYATRIELVTKVLIARDANVARYALPTACLLVMVFLLYGNLYLGAAARVLVWERLPVADQAFPALVREVLGPVPAAVALTGIASAAMSTTDSLLLLTGAAVAHDLLRKSWHEHRGIVRTERYYLNASRLAIVAAGVLSFVAALNTPALILAIVSYAVGMIGATFFAPLLIGLTWRRATRLGAVAASTGGFAVTVVWTGFTLAGAAWATSLHPMVPGLAVSLSLMALVSLRTQPAAPGTLARYFDEAASRRR